MNVRKACVVTVTGLAVAVLSWSLVRREVYYQGQPASYWVKKARLGDNSQTTITALESLGPEAVLPLLKAAVREDSLFESRYARIYGRLPTLLKKFLPQPAPNKRLYAHQGRSRALENQTRRVERRAGARSIASGKGKPLAN